MKTQKAQNFMRSANAPVISAGVMTANMHWKIMKSLVRDGGGVVRVRRHARRRASPSQSRPPMMPPWSGPKARL